MTCQELLKDAVSDQLDVLAAMLGQIAGINLSNA
jgi:hypothetical protein